MAKLMLSSEDTVEGEAETGGLNRETHLSKTPPLKESELPSTSKSKETQEAMSPSLGVP